jgi:hypothetical protein
MAKPSQRRPINGLLPSSRLSCLYKNIGVRPRCAAPRARYAGSRRNGVSHMPQQPPYMSMCGCCRASRPMTHRASPGRPPRTGMQSELVIIAAFGSQAPHLPEPLARLDRRHELTRVRAVDAVERGATPPRAAHDISRALKCRRNSSPPLRRPHNPIGGEPVVCLSLDYAAMVRGWRRRGSRSGCGSVRPCGRAAIRVDRPTRKPIVKSA